MNKIKWLWRIVISILGGLFWRAGGSDKYPKGVRRYGVSGLLGIISFLFKKSWVALLTMGLAVGAFSLGYGIPNSAIASLLVSLGITTHLTLQILTRIIVGFAYGIILLPLICIKKAHWQYIFIPMILVPIICLFGLTATVEEFLIGSIVVGNFLLALKK